MKRPDKDASLLELVREAFENSKRRYGYKRIHLELKGMGVRVSTKRVMRLMTSHGLVPLFKSANRYSSYKGELTKAPKNLVNRDFHAERPNMLWIRTSRSSRSPPARRTCHRSSTATTGFRSRGRSARVRTPSWPTACSPTRAPRSRTARNQSSIPTMAATTGGRNGSASARGTI